MGGVTAETAEILSSDFQRLIGFCLVEWRSGYAAVNLQIRREHLNRAGTLHGGVLSTLIDAAGGMSGNYCSSGKHTRSSITLTLSTNFILPVKAGTVRAVGVRKGGGRRIFFSRIEVLSDEDAVVATGDATYQLAPAAE